MIIQSVVLSVFILFATGKVVEGTYDFGSESAVAFNGAVMTLDQQMAVCEDTAEQYNRIYKYIKLENRQITCDIFTREAE